MLIEKSNTIKKFATAFINNYEKEINKDYIDKIENLIGCLKENKILLAIISRPSLSEEKKDEIIDSISKKLPISTQIKKLIYVLIHKSKTDLLIGILKKIILIHKQKTGIQKFLISTSHELDEPQKNKVAKFLESKIGNAIEISFRIDKSLISGIKIKSPTILLEHSVSKKIREFKKILLREEIW